MSSSLSSSRHLRLSPSFISLSTQSPSTSYSPHYSLFLIILLKVLLSHLVFKLFALYFHCFPIFDFKTRFRNGFIKFSLLFEIKNYEKSQATMTCYTCSINARLDHSEVGSGQLDLLSHDDG